MGGAVSIGKKHLKVRGATRENKNQEEETNNNNNTNTNTSPPSAVTSNSRLDVAQQMTQGLRGSPHEGYNFQQQRIGGSTAPSPNEINQSPFGVRGLSNSRFLGSETSPVFSTPHRQLLSDGSAGSRAAAFNRPLLSHRSDVSEASGHHQTADLFAQTAMSLGLEGDDLLFNMMFFDDGQGGTFGQLLNTMQQETLALHSEHNTPYRLNPADESAIAELIEEEFEMNTTGEDIECQVCKDEIENGNLILRIPHCRHYFHQDCLMKWISLQAWCPVCRSSLEHKGTEGKVQKMDSVAEIGSQSSELAENRNVRLPFPAINLDEELVEISPLNGRLQYEDLKEEIPVMAEAKLSSPIQFYDIDAKGDHTRDHYDWDEKQRSGNNSPYGRYSLEQQIAVQSTEKIIYEAMQAIYQEKVSI